MRLTLLSQPFQCLLSFSIYIHKNKEPQFQILSTKTLPINFETLFMKYLKLKTRIKFFNLLNHQKCSPKSV